MPLCRIFRPRAQYVTMIRRAGPSSRWNDRALARRPIDKAGKHSSRPRSPMVRRIRKTSSAPGGSSDVSRLLMADRNPR